MRHCVVIKVLFSRCILENALSWLECKTTSEPVKVKLQKIGHEDVVSVSRYKPYIKSNGVIQVSII